MSLGPLTSRAEPIPGYTLLERIGGGGFGEVYKCRAPGGILKAIKFVYGDLDGLGDEGKGAEQERKALRRVLEVRHPFILSIERIDEVEGRLVIVMELADRNLWDRYRECRTQNLPGIPRDELLRYMEEAAEALDLMNAAHNLQHLDIKPQNLFLVANHVKVADFGLVKDFAGGRATVTGGVTPVYAAPETFDGKASRFCDQYSLAIVYQELLTGQRPFDGSTTRRLMLQHLQEPPNLAPLPESDRPVLGRSLAKKPEDRFATCAALVEALRAAAAPTAVPTPPARTPPPSGLVPPPMPSRITAPRPSGLVPPPMPSESRPRGPQPGDTPHPAMTQLRGAAPVTQLRPAHFPSVAVSQLPVAPPEATGDGVLMPALVIGLGKLGGLVVGRLRAALAERFGDPAAAATLRVLAIDTDADDAQALCAGPAAPLDPRCLVTARLNRPAHYLRGGTGVEAWMDPGLLYRLPKNPTTGGVRAFGRLALADFGHAVAGRIRGELEAALDPAAMLEAARATGLTLRTNRPRVYVVANPAGGTGGGMVLDVAYLARSALLQLGYARPEVVGVLLMPPAERAGGASPAAANTYAALTELAHFSAAGTRYEFRYSPRHPPLVDADAPFARVLAVSLPPTADAAAQRQSAGHTAGLIYRELLAPLGRAADAARAAVSPAGATPPVQTAGAYRFSWPRRRLQRRGALRLAEALLRHWTAKDAGPVKLPVAAWLDEQWEGRQLRPELIIERVEEVCTAEIGLTPDAKFDALVGPLAERTILGSKLDAWSVCHVLDDIFELVGKPAASGEDEPAPALLQKAVGGVTARLSAEYMQTPAQVAAHFTEQPGYRLAAAEEAVRQLAARVAAVVQTYEDLHKALLKEAQECYARLFPLIGKLEGYATAAKQAAAASEVLELLKAYPKKRYQGMVAGFVLQVYRSMASEAPECLREVNFCRQRLAEVQAALAQTAAAEAAQGSALGPGRDLFPGGGTTVDDAARALVAGLAAGELLDLDSRTQNQVRRQFQSVANYCVEASGESGPMAELLAKQCEEFLAPRLATATAAEVFFQHYLDAQAAQRDLAAAYEEAEPELRPSNSEAGAEVCILAAPAGEYGDELRRLAAEVHPDATFLPADSADDVVVHRELCGVSLADLPQMGPAARAAYETACASETPPHARADVTWGG